MKKTATLLFVLFLIIGCKEAQTQKKESDIKSKDMQQQEPTKPEETEQWEPQPVVVDPGSAATAPSDAIVLFNGTDLAEWVSAKDTSRAADWILNEDGSMTVRRGFDDIQTKRDFGSVQLHIEWRSPTIVVDEGQDRGNSGIFLQNRYEVQVLDNYENKTYANGQAGSLYKQTPPLVNACRPPGEWQTYDIIFHAPEFDRKGEKTRSATITVLHNGILVQDHTEILGTTEYIGWPKNKAHGKAPLKLQDHDCDVSYRNIWVREL